MHGEQAQRAAARVAACSQNCWMVTTARTAMRSSLHPGLPKLSPLAWVVWNKLKVSFGGRIDFARYIDYEHVRPSPVIPRKSFLGENVKAHVKLQRGLKTPEEHYPLQEFFNR